MYNLPRPYLSYSSIIIWLKNKEEYRRRYYYTDSKPFESIYTRFGKYIAELLEKDDESVKFIPRYSHPEFKIDFNIDGVPIKAFIDSFDPETFSFYEYKTSIKDNWNDKTVEEHMQLPFYSLLIKEIYGHVNNECKLFALKTRFKDNVIVFQGHKLEGKKQLELTGEIKEFKRIITDEERKNIRLIITTVAKEISDDYTDWQKKLPVDKSIDTYRVLV